MLKFIMYKICPRAAQRFLDLGITKHSIVDRRTLRELDPFTHIFATRAAAELIRSWHHFLKVHEIATLSKPDQDWTAFSSEALPAWMGIARLVSSFDVGFLHSAVVIFFNLNHSQTECKKPKEAIIYTPHGISAKNLSQLSHTQPPIQPLALVHGLHEVSVCRLGQLNLGAVNGLEAQQVINAKYWITTHDVRRTSRHSLFPVVCTCTSE